ncbi:hypothetical protein ABZ419_26655 [Streptomyces cinnamoneus]|uniref:hypothetical protein n=1 Tax=Streptomyces cinnamoneus TaxID=53446 RepID=UPI0033EB3E86
MQIALEPGSGRRAVPHGWRLRHQRTRPAAEAQTPDLAALFATEDCPCKGKDEGEDEDEDEDCEECRWQFTPRTADLLHTALAVLADQASTTRGAPEISFCRLLPPRPGRSSTGCPPLTWPADHRRRRRMARAFDDLAADLAKGKWPTPTCTAQEMALHLAIEDAPACPDERPEDDDHNTLPEHEDDYSWDSCSDLLLQDHDVLMPFHAPPCDIQNP